MKQVKQLLDTGSYDVTLRFYAWAPKSTISVAVSEMQRGGCFSFYSVCGDDRSGVSS